MTLDANTAFSRCVADEWSRSGLTDAVVSPGSRSTPLALALADHPAITVHVHIDERSASFFALGLAKVTGRPAVVLCTSGTAAANFHPAVLEASYARVPMIVCTADRPPELRQVGDGQTVDQARLYGGAVRWYSEPEAPRSDAGETALWATWRSLADRAVAESLGPPAGPVHLNLPFREPLVSANASDVPFDLGGRPDGRPWLRVARARQLAGDDVVEGLARRISATTKGVVVAGWGADLDADCAERLARAAQWPILADPLSGLRGGPAAVSTYDALARIDAVKDALRPDLVLRVGAPLTSKYAMGWLGTSPTVVVDPQCSWADPQRAADQVLAVEPQPLFSALAERISSPSGPWLASWLDAEETARRVIDSEIDAWSEPFEGRMARDVMAWLPDGAVLMVASSMPVRDVEMFAAPRRGVTVLANRGVNGIDGFVSSALGVAAGNRGSRSVALLGDLCLLHDSNGLLGAQRRNIDLVLVVIDNNGGGIFSFLPQVTATSAPRFEELFGTPHDIDIAALGALHGIPVTEVNDAAHLVSALADADAAKGVAIVHVRTERADNAQRHAQIFRAVADALSR